MEKATLQAIRSTFRTWGWRDLDFQDILPKKVRRGGYPTMEAVYRIERLDHLGIVAGICNTIDLIGHIDRLVPGPRRQVSVGETVQAMVLNALGFVSRPLYLTPDFFRHKPLDLLIRPGLTADMLNDDSLGRALDKLYEAGLTGVFAQVASAALHIFGITYRFVHADTSSFHVHGAYEPTSQEPGVIQITYGYSRDHRPDLKQAVVGLLTSYRSALPVWIQALSGNAADAQTLPAMVQAYLDQWKGAAPDQPSSLPYFVADSAWYTEENIRTLSPVIGWITRVPERIALVRALQRAIEPERMLPAPQEGYRYAELCTTYGGIRQRWLVVHSEAAEKRDREALQKQVAKEKERAEREMRRLAKREFPSQRAAEQAVQQHSRRWRYHRAEVNLLTRPHYGQRGRPGKAHSPEQLGWRIGNWEITQASEALENADRQAGKFVLATNILDEHSLPPEELLTAYKGQGVGPERGFRFLKDPLFYADSLFLKSPRRIMALTTVMGLALLIYALAEHTLQQRLQERGEAIPNQVGKPTQRPTMRWVFQLMEGIDVLIVETAQGTQRHIVNLTEVQRLIIRLLEPYVQKCYLDSS